eukprot:72176-Rhodomonas_salina.1
MLEAEALWRISHRVSGPRRVVLTSGVSGIAGSSCGERRRGEGRGDSTARRKTYAYAVSICGVWYDCSVSVGDVRCSYALGTEKGCAAPRRVRERAQQAVRKVEEVRALACCAMSGACYAMSNSVLYAIPRFCAQSAILSLVIRQACCAMSGTDTGDADTRRERRWRSIGRLRSVSPYAPDTRCPGLIWCIMLPPITLRAPYAMSGTDLVYHAIPGTLCCCFVTLSQRIRLPGTGLAYHATRHWSSLSCHL